MFRTVTTRSLRFRPQTAAGFTLLEVSVVLVILAILLTVALPSLQPSGTQRLSCAANLLASDLRLVRGLAIRDGTEFTLTLTEKGWKIEHTGSGSPPTMPAPALGGVGSEASTYEIDASLLVGGPVRIEGRLAATGTATDTIAFASTGRTVAFEDTVFWLSWGEGENKVSLPLTVAAPTGFLTKGAIVPGSPPAD